MVSKQGNEAEYDLDVFVSAQKTGRGLSGNAITSLPSGILDNLGSLNFL